MLLGGKESAAALHGWKSIKKLTVLHRSLWYGFMEHDTFGYVASKGPELFLAKLGGGTGFEDSDGSTCRFSLTDNIT